jgi:hypothetical protein
MILGSSAEVIIGRRSWKEAFEIQLIKNNQRSSLDNSNDKLDVRYGYNIWFLGITDPSDVVANDFFDAMDLAQARSQARSRTAGEKHCGAELKDRSSSNLSEVASGSTKPISGELSSRIESDQSHVNCNTTTVPSAATTAVLPAVLIAEPDVPVYAAVSATKSPH